MSNLNNNTTQLESLLAKVNALPEAGGVSMETCTVQISIYNIEDVDVQNAAKVTYVNGENECAAVALTLDDWTDHGSYWSISLTVVKGTFIYSRLGTIGVMSGKAQRLDSYGNTVLINGDASLYYS